MSSDQAQPGSLTNLPATTPTWRRAAVRRAAAGGNVIDTADVYTNGTSETIMGELLKGRRDQFVLATTAAILRQADERN